MIRSGINSQLLGINQQNTSYFIYFIVFLSLEVIAESILLVHLILFCVGYKIGVVEVSVIAGITLIIQTCNFCFILFVSHRMSQYSKQRKEMLKNAEKTNKKIIEDAIDKAIHDTTYNIVDDDTVVIPYDYIEEAR